MAVSRLLRVCSLLCLAAAISPGITYSLTPAVQLYAFVQVPVYQRVNGVQLVADRSYAVGVSAQF